MTIDEKLAPDSIGALFGVGDRLKFEREARGLSIDDVSQTLKVSPRILEQVEANAWGELPGYTFVRGIVRGYAKFVQMDAEPLLQELESAPLLKRPNLELPMSTRAALPITGKSRSRDKVAIFSGVFLVTASITAYFLVPENWFGARNATAVVPVAQIPIAAPATVGELPAAQTIATISGTASDANNSTAGPMVIPLGVSPVQQGVLAVPASSQVAVLILRFDENSWVEVKDRNGVMLLSENVAAGAERTINVGGAISLALGNADGVRATFRDQPVDLKPHTRQKVARLTLE